jgi:uncharacterized repeat protein (TIGR02543 family)
MSFAISVPAYAFSQVHAVTFFENVNASDPVSAFESANAPQPLTLVQNLDPSFSNPGYTFVGWNTSINDSGTAYSDGSTYSFTSDIGLYAQWLPIPEVHNVTFFENANATDSVTAMQAATTPQGLLLIQNLDPSFSNPGYTFVGWNTSANGSGSSYMDGSTYSFNADIGLYAQWVAISVVRTLTLYENDSASDSIDSTMTGITNSSITPFSSIQPTFSNAGHSFVGWNTSANGSGTSYADGAQYSFGSNAALYAQWVVIAAPYTVTFYENDSASDSVSSSMSATEATPFTQFADMQPTFVNGSHMFSGWNTSRDGTGTSYSDGFHFPFQTNLILYAQWTLTVVDTYSFSANGGSGTISSISGSPGSNLVIPGQTGLIRAGFALADWNTSANGSGTKYLVGENVTITGSTLLFAQWSGHKPATLFGAIGTFKTDSSALSANLKSQINRVALTIKSRKYLKIDLFGYSATTGLKSLNISLSRSRAVNVGTYLRNRLRVLKVRGVSISSSGQGSIAGQSSKAYSRVEVFGV